MTKQEQKEIIDLLITADIRLTKAFVRMGLDDDIEANIFCPLNEVMENVANLETE